MLLIIRCKSRNNCAYIDAVFNEIFHRFNEKYFGLGDWCFSLKNPVEKKKFVDLPPSNKTVVSPI